MYPCLRIYFKKNIESENFRINKNSKNENIDKKNKYDDIENESINSDNNLNNLEPLISLNPLDFNNPNYNLRLLTYDENFYDDFSEYCLNNFETDKISDEKSTDLSTNSPKYPEYFKEISYFCKFYDKLNSVILKVIVKDKNENDEILFSSIEKNNSNNNSDHYQSIDKIQKAKYIIIDMVKDINFFCNYSSNYGPQINLGDLICFKTFSEYIFHLRKIFRVIVESYNNYDSNKKEKFIELLVKLIDKYYCILLIDELIPPNINKKLLLSSEYKSKPIRNNIDNFKNEENKSKIDSINISERLKDLDIQIKKLTEKCIGSQDLEFIKVCGKSHILNLNSIDSYNFIKSIEVSKYPITNYQYLKFVEKGGYYKEKYWSKDGYYWKNFTKLNKPIHWEHKNNIWYADGNLLRNYYDYPITKISYYEAEACCKFYSCRLPYELEWNFISSNRNYTLNPYGLYNSESLDIVSDFEDVRDVKYGKGSIMDFKQLYGNIWEYTKTSRTISNSEHYLNTEVCLKGGDNIMPEFLINNDLKFYLPRDFTGLNTGFRMIKE